MFLAIVVHGLTVTSLPVELFSLGTVKIVQGCNVWLFCEVDSVVPTLSLVWTKDNAVVMMDLPLIRMRNKTIGTRTLYWLILEEYSFFNVGTYSCFASDGSTTAQGGTVTLTCKCIRSQILHLRYPKYLKIL